MEFRREQLEAEILDHRLGFERQRLPLEIRWDPLTGTSSRLLPAHSLPPPSPVELEELAERSRPGCPFCEDVIDAQTPRLPAEISPKGRICIGEAVLFPNLVAYAKWSAVSVYSPKRHLVPLEEISGALLSDNLDTQVEYARAVIAHDPSSTWVSINANHLPSSGSSIFHPHLQGSANPVPTTTQRLLADVPPQRFRAYVDAERSEGSRYLRSKGSFDWLASFAPIGPAELRAFVFEAASPAELSRDLVSELARGIAAALRLYAELGFQSFNLAIYGAPPGTQGYPLNLRMLPRSSLGPLLRSDVMWSERLHSEAATDLAPERIAEQGRVHFARLE